MVWDPGIQNLDSSSTVLVHTASFTVVIGSQV